MKQYLPELLAPAKNKDFGITAINHGADAVYIAAQKFGAREAAGNSINDIEELVHYAHRYHARVYLTLNTIIFENELEEARQLATQAYNIGCDALIVQDMALLEMDLPPIPLHASTQTNNLNPDKVKFLEAVGFSRVILGRELSITEISAIHEQTPVELEAFVHGALCVSHSGQCYLSSALTGRSANRGACAQPCRSAYDLVDSSGKLLLKNKHLLSLRDFNLSEKLEQLLLAGVSSFKIEGRLKNSTYLKNTTSYYRKELDRIGEKLNLAHPSSGKVSFSFEANPNTSFSRGFTPYFADGKKPKPGSMASIHTPKSVGEPIGRVSKVGDRWITIDSQLQLNNGDGICFFDGKKVLRGTKINNIENGKLFLLSMDGIVTNSEVFRNYNHLLEKQLAGETAKRLIAVKLYFKADENTITISAEDEDGICVRLVEPQMGEHAKNAEQAAKTLVANLSKSGGSIFSFHVQVDSNASYFYPLATINSWRRTLVDLLEEERTKKYVQQEVRIEKNSIPYPDKSITYLGNVSNSLAKKFYERHGVQNIEPAFELQAQHNEPLMITHYCIRQELGICGKGKDGKNAEPLYLLNNGRQLKVTFDCERCGMVITLRDYTTTQ